MGAPHRETRTGIAVLAFIVAAAAAQFNSPADLRADCSDKADGIYPIGHCSAEFLECSGGRSVKQACSSGLWFNPQSLQCDYRELIAVCQDAFSCVGRSDGVYGEGCSAMFWFCRSGQLMHTLCPEGLFFSPEKQQCDYRGNIRACGGGETTRTTSSSAPQGTRLVETAPATTSASSTSLVVNDEPANDGTTTESPYGQTYPTYAPRQRISGTIAKTPLSESSAGTACAGKADGAHAASSCSPDYVLCWAGTGEAMHCPQGLRFNELTAGCDYPQNVAGCSEAVSSADASEAFSAYAPLPAPADVLSPAPPAALPIPRQRVDFDEYCSDRADGLYSTGCVAAFYQCVSGAAYQQECPAGLVFDHHTKSCDYPEICSAPQDAPAAYSTAASTMTPAADVISSSIDCSSRVDGLYSEGCVGEFVHCIAGVTYPARCPEGLVFDGVKQSCDYADNCGQPRPLDDDEAAVAVYQPALPVTLDHAQPPTAPAASIGFDCSTRTDGVYSGPSPCSGVFFQCAAGLVYSQICPQGLVFDERSGACDYPEICTGKQQQLKAEAVPVLVLTPSTPVPTLDSLTPPTIDCVGHADGFFSTGCTRPFVQCVSGMAFTQLCPEGLVFVQASGRCDYPSECTVSADAAAPSAPYAPQFDSTPTTAAPVIAAATTSAAERDAGPKAVLIDCTTLTDGMYSSGCTHAFVQCVAGTAYPLECPAGLVFEKSSSRCTWPEECAPSTEAALPTVSLPVTRPPSADAPATVYDMKSEGGATTTAATDAPMLELSKDGMTCTGTGRRAMGKCSSGFVQCIGGKLIARRCPGQSLFDEKIALCVYDLEGCEMDVEDIFEENEQEDTTVMRDATAGGIQQQQPQQQTSSRYPQEQQLEQQSSQYSRPTTTGQQQQQQYGYQAGGYTTAAQEQQQSQYQSAAQSQYQTGYQQPAQQPRYQTGYQQQSPQYPQQTGGYSTLYQTPAQYESGYGAPSGYSSSSFGDSPASSLPLVPLMLRETGTGAAAPECEMGAFRRVSACSPAFYVCSPTARQWIRKACGKSHRFDSAASRCRPIFEVRECDEPQSSYVPPPVESPSAAVLSSVYGVAESVATSFHYAPAPAAAAPASANAYEVKTETDGFSGGYQSGRMGSNPFLAVGNTGSFYTRDGLGWVGSSWAEQGGRHHRNHGHGDFVIVSGNPFDGHHRRESRVLSDEWRGRKERLRGGERSSLASARGHRVRHVVDEFKGRVDHFSPPLRAVNPFAVKRGDGHRRRGRKNCRSHRNKHRRDEDEDKECDFEEDEERKEKRRQHDKEEDEDGAEEDEAELPEQLEKSAEVESLKPINEDGAEEKVEATEPVEENVDDDNNEIDEEEGNVDKAVDDTPMEEVTTTTTTTTATPSTTTTGAAAEEETDEKESEGQPIDGESEEPEEEDDESIDEEEAIAESENEPVEEREETEEEEDVAERGESVKDENEEEEPVEAETAETTDAVELPESITGDETEKAVDGKKDTESLASGAVEETTEAEEMEEPEEDEEERETAHVEKSEEESHPSDGEDPDSPEEEEDEVATKETGETTTGVKTVEKDERKEPVEEDAEKEDARPSDGEDPELPPAEDKEIEEPEEEEVGPTEKAATSSVAAEDDNEESHPSDGVDPELPSEEHEDEIEEPEEEGKESTEPVSETGEVEEPKEDEETTPAAAAAEKETTEEDEDPSNGDDPDTPAEMEEEEEGEEVDGETSNLEDGEEKDGKTEGKMDIEMKFEKGEAATIAESDSEMVPEAVDEDGELNEGAVDELDEDGEEKSRRKRSVVYGGAVPAATASVSRSSPTITRRRMVLPRSSRLHRSRFSRLCGGTSTPGQAISIGQCRQDFVYCKSARRPVVAACPVGDLFDALMSTCVPTEICGAETANLVTSDAPSVAAASSSPVSADYSREGERPTMPPGSVDQSTTVSSVSSPLETSSTATTTSGAAPAEDLESSFSCAGRSNGAFPSSSCSGHYFVCSGSEQFSYSCPTGLIYDQRSDSCAWPTEMPECGAFSTTSTSSDAPSSSSSAGEQPYAPTAFVASRDASSSSSSTLVPTTVAPLMHVAFDCGRKDGAFAIDCKGGFVMCSNGEASLMRCPAALTFDEATQSCQYPAHVASCGVAPVVATSAEDDSSASSAAADSAWTYSSTVAPPARTQEALVNTPIEKNVCSGVSSGLRGSSSLLGCSSSFVICEESSVMAVMTCPDGTFFNEATKACDYRELACAARAPTAAGWTGHAHGLEEIVEQHDEKPAVSSAADESGEYGRRSSRPYRPAMPVAVEKIEKSEESKRERVSQVEKPVVVHSATEMAEGALCDWKGAAPSGACSSKFIICSNGKPESFECAASLVFDASTSACAYPQFLPGCSQFEGTATPLAAPSLMAEESVAEYARDDPLSPSTTTLRPLLPLKKIGDHTTAMFEATGDHCTFVADQPSFPLNYCSMTYAVCTTDGMAYKTNCTFGYLFDSVIRRCVPAEHCGQAYLKEIAGSMPPTSSPIAHMKEFAGDARCAGAKDGALKATALCSTHYIRCEKEATMVETCAGAAQVFSPLTGRCVLRVQMAECASARGIAPAITRPKAPSIPAAASSAVPPLSPSHRGARIRGGLSSPTSSTAHFDAHSFCATKNVDGLYRNPENCAGIVQCFGGEAFSYPSCAPGLFFNEKEGQCDYSSNVPECASDASFQSESADGGLLRDSSSSSSISCKGEPHGAHLADDVDCSVYYRCVWGSLERLACPEGTVFNPRLSVCDYRSEVPHCKDNSQ